MLGEKEKMTGINSKLALLKIDRSEVAEAAPGRRKLAMLGIAGVVVCALAAGWFGATRFRAVAAPTATAPPASAPAPAGVPAGRLTASGFVTARRRTTVASEVTGRLREVRVEEGQQVRSGQVLAVLDSSVIDREVTMLQARLASSQSAAQAAAADLADAQDTLARTTKLSATGFLSTASLNHDRRRVDSLHAQLARGNSDIVAARADTARLQAQRGQYEIRAPFSGVVVDRNAQSGEIVSPISGAGGFTRTGICTIVDMDSLEIQADINEAFIGQVHEGQTVDAILDAYPKQVIAARVLAIIPTVNRDKASVRVRIAFLNNDRRVLPDMAVKVSFNQSTTTRE